MALDVAARKGAAPRHRESNGTCSSQVEVPVEISVTSDDGLLNERWSTVVVQDYNKGRLEYLRILAEFQPTEMDGELMLQGLDEELDSKVFLFLIQFSGESVFGEIWGETPCDSDSSGCANRDVYLAAINDGLNW